MFPGRYFPARYFAPRYFANLSTTETGSVPNPVQTIVARNTNLTTVVQSPNITTIKGGS